MTKAGQGGGQHSASAEAMMAFILRLRSNGLTDQRVLNAVSTLPRPLFVMPEHAGLAWNDVALPLPCGQCITPPVLATTLAERLAIEPHHRVLEIGTGSGYLTAVLARLAARVMTMERWRTLTLEAEERLRIVEILNVTTVVADGRQGWPDEGPYDRIVVTSAAEELDDALLHQLKPGGRMIIPLGPAGGEQVLTLIERTGEGARKSELQQLRLGSLLAGVAACL